MKEYSHYGNFQGKIFGSKGRTFLATKGAFTRQRKNGTDPTKTGTVPIVFAKKLNFYPFRVGSIGAFGPVAVRMPFLLGRVNAPLEPAGPKVFF